MDPLVKEGGEEVAAGAIFEEGFGKTDGGLAGEEGTRGRAPSMEESAGASAEGHFCGPGDGADGRREEGAKVES